MDAFFGLDASSSIQQVVFSPVSGLYLLMNGSLLTCGASFIPGFETVSIEE